MTTTKHMRGCNRVFARLDPDCPRCKELAAGAERRPWVKPERVYSSGSRRYSVRIGNGLYATARHSCAASHCGPICTWGEW